MDVHCLVPLEIELDYFRCDLFHEFEYYITTIFGISVFSIFNRN